YRSVAEAAWAWVQTQLRWTDGPWIPEAATTPPATEVPAYRDGMHSGLGGLAHVLAEIRLAREWAGPERELAEVIADRVRSVIPAEHDVSFFDGLTSTIGVLVALDADGVGAAVARLAELATPDG